MNPTCGCCEGTRQLTPADSGNRPGLDAILYRAGTHSTFLETMKARLSNWVLDPPAGHTSPGKRGSSPLLGLSTRDDTDFAIALLDAWAMVADVLTFYQDRIANEGYLRTATERLSIVELARLIGYEPRPGVAASVYLAYTIDSDKSKPKPAPTFTDIPAGSRAQSIPGPGELPQSFETSAPLKASDIWNNLRVRQTQPQAILPTDKALYFKGIATNLKPGDRLLLDFGKAQTPRQVLTVEPDADHNRTKVTLDVSLEQAGALPKLQGPETLGSKLIQLTESLTQTLQPHPSSSVQLQRDLKTAFSESSDLRPRLVAALHPEIAPQQLYTALENAPALPAPIADVYVFRTRASPFGANSPKKQVFGFNNQIKDPVEWPLTTVVSIALDSFTMLVSVINATQSESSIPRGWSVDTRIHLDRLPPPKEESPVPPKPVISGVPFQIAFPDADDMIKVTFTQHIGAVPPFRLQYEFQRLKVNFSIGPAESTSANEIPGVEILSKGTDPTAVATVSMHSDRGTTAHYFRIKVTAPIAASTKPTETLAKISLDNIYDKIVPGGWILLEGTNQSGHFINAAAKKAKSFQIKTTQPLAAGQILTVALGSPHQEDVTVESYVPSTNTVTITGKFDHDHPEGTYLLWTALDPLVSRVKAVSERSRADYGITGKITEVTLDGNKTWLDLPEPDALGQPDLSVVRRVAVFAQSEKLELAEQPIDPLPLSLEKIDSIELDGIYPGLESGRWLIVSGKRADIHIPAAELVMLAGSEQKASKCDKLHTFLNLAGGLSYDYEPGSVTIYGNVAHATHGETRAEVLGSGDSSHPLQQFQLKQSSITYVSAATPNGIESTLKVRVNDILWHEAPGLAFLGPNGRSYVTRTGDDSKTTVVFGNGVRGARVPTGVENVKAVYRTGIGKPGNVKAEQISLLATKPLGVKDVINPIRASGGADRESRDQARRNAPLAVMALDRLVSIQDYADFARTFAGVGKASATQIGGRVHVTIAGADSIPIDKSSDLFLNLMAAFGKFGDPQQPIQLDVCMPMLLVIQAKVAILPDYQFETVAPKIHNALLAALSFDNRGLGQDVIQSEIIATIQSVEGVQYVDLDTLDTLSMDMDAIFKDLDSLQKQRSLRKRIPVELAHRDSSGNIVPAQLAFLTPDISETLILTEFTDAR